MELDLTTVLDTMAVGVFICDAKHELVALNHTALQIVGAKTIDEIRGKDGRPFHFPRVRGEDGKPIPFEKMPFERALSGEEVVTEMELFEDERGMTMLRTRTAPLRDREGKIIGAVKVAVDVTKEYELARVKEEFIRQAAHELKTPVSVIKANAQSLALDTPPEERVVQALTRGVDRIDGLINSLLDLLDLQGGLFSFSRLPVRLRELVDGALSRLPARAARRVHVIASSDVCVEWDEARMRRAFYAIIDNALKYSRPDTTVEISLTSTDSIARLEVRDHGVGIPAEKQSRMFEKFFRAHAGTPLDAGGIGVGLFVARAIIAQHGGRIWFDSEENRGSTFYVELPIEGESR
ncbi:MAG: PAS domain-containing protein [Kofleriaceae bacterium]|nr:PAS domain-containing protein [Kofleriaceae bacterium]